MRATRSLFLQICAGALLLSACGGGGGSKSPPPVTGPPPPPAPGFVALQSEVGDFVGAGLNYRYTKADARFDVAATGRRVTVWINGDEEWVGDFELPDIYTQVEVGVYNNVTRYRFHDAAIGGMSWAGEARACIQLAGSFEITSVSYVNSVLSEIRMNFEQFCAGSSSALRGEIHWYADDQTSPPPPVYPPPAGLWEPPPGTTPDAGDYVYLESEVGDYVGAGNTYLYTPDVAQFTVTGSDKRFRILVNGSESWEGDFEGMWLFDRFELGYYGDLQGYPFNNWVKGGLRWIGEGRGCGRLEGWFVIDDITYDGADIQSIQLRFEQRCEGETPALNGEIRWTR